MESQYIVIDYLDSAMIDIRDVIDDREKDDMSDLKKEARTIFAEVQQKGRNQLISEVFQSKAMRKFIIDKTTEIVDSLLVIE